MSYDIASNDFHRAGAASRAIKDQLKRIGAGAEAVRRAMIAAYEAEMNVVIHSVGGRLQACLTDSQIDVSVVDDGPGIPDVEQALVEGFSTAGAEARALGFGAGMGLPNIRRNSDRFRITSKTGEGTRVDFTIFLQPGQTHNARPISLYAVADRCRDCRACLRACPTQAMRVRDGRPSVLEHLCIDCGECIGACSAGALVVRDEVSSLNVLEGVEEALLIVPPALLAGCGPDYSPAQVLSALRELGFAGVATSDPHEQALRAAVSAAAGVSTCPRPVIAPSCPAIVKLVELRFPSLVPHLAPLDSPWEASQAINEHRRTAYVVSCPSQRSALLLHAPLSSSPGPDGPAPIECLSPDVARQAVMVKLTGGGSAPGADEVATGAPPVEARVAAPGDPGTGDDPAVPTPTPADTDPAGLLTVTGIRHVVAVLEAIEDGLLDDVAAIEPYACRGGCFGSPLLSEDYHVAALRWNRGRAAAEALAPAEPTAAVPRRNAFAARPGIRLDADMGKAIEKLGRMQAVIRSLPGKDCGSCGAPTCGALAEDVVMERAHVGLCPYITVTDAEEEGGDR